MADAPALTAEMIRKAVEALKKANPSTPDQYLLMAPGKWYAYDEIDIEETLKLEHKDIDMSVKFKEIDEKIKREWGQIND